jgi:hypothetical protein
MLGDDLGQGADRPEGEAKDHDAEKEIERGLRKPTKPPRRIAEKGDLGPQEKARRNIAKEQRRKAPIGDENDRLVIGARQIAGKAHHQNPTDDLKNLIGQRLEAAAHGIAPVLISEFVDKMGHAPLLGVTRAGVQWCDSPRAKS